MIMGIILIALGAIGIMYRLTLIAYLSENKVLDELISEN